MSVPNLSLLISIKCLELEQEQENKEEKQCQVFHNSKNVSVLQVNDPNVSALIANLSSNDKIQLIFAKNDNGENIGSISLTYETLIKNNIDSFSKWINLYNDPNDDFFSHDDNKHFPESKNQFPRALVCFKLTKSDDKKNEPDINHFQPIQTASECLDNSITGSELLQDDYEIANIKVTTEYAIDDYEDKPLAHHETVPRRNSNSTLSRQRDGLCLQDEQDLVKSPSQDDKDANLDESSSSISMLSNSSADFDNPMKILKRDFVKEIAQLSDKLQQATNLAKSAKELRETITKRDDCCNMEIDDQTLKDYKEQAYQLRTKNESLNNRLQDVLNKLEILQNENIKLKKNENICAEKLCKAKINIEKMRLSAEDQEKYIKELQRKLVEAQNQVKEEIQSKMKLMKEKEKVSETLYKLNGKYEQLKKKEEFNKERLSRKLSQINRNDSERGQDSEQDLGQLTIRNQNGKSKDNVDQEARLDNYLLKQRVNELEAQIQEYKQTIKRLEDLLKNPEKQSGTKKISDLLTEADTRRISDDNKFEPIERPLNQLNHLDEFEYFTQNHLKGDSQKSKTEPNFISDNLLKTDNLVIKSLLNQIAHLQSYVKSLEEEKNTLKNELFGAHENYSKLTNKYIELTEILTGIKDESKSCANNKSRCISAEKGNLSFRYNTDFSGLEENDEIELKLNEFIKSNKIVVTSMSRIDKNSFILNGKKVFLKILNKKLLVYMNGAYKTIEEFWKISKENERTKTPPPLTRFKEVFGNIEIRSQAQTPDRKHNYSLTNKKLSISGLEKQIMIKESVGRIDGLFDFHKDGNTSKTRNENMKQKDSNSSKIIEKKSNQKFKPCP